MIRKYKMPFNTKGYAETIKIPQYDTGYEVVFDITGLPEGTTTLDGYTAMVEGLRSDGLAYDFQCTVSGTQVSFTVDTTCTGCPGRGEARIRFLLSGEEIAAHKFIMEIEKSPVPDEAVDADVAEQQSLLEQITELAEQTEQAADGIIDMTVSAQTLAQGADATVTKTVTDGAVNLHFGLPLADGEVEVVNVTGANPTITAESNKRYVCGEVSTLTITPVTSGITDVRFTSGTTATVLSLPQTVKMPEWFTVEASKTYEISILDGIYGAVMSWT